MRPALISKPDKDIRKPPKLQISISHEHRFKNPHKILANQTQQSIERNLHHDQNEIITSMESWFNIKKKNQCNLSHQQAKEEKSHNHIDRCRKSI